jgi:hemerythrin-like domain-containing protein
MFLSGIEMKEEEQDETLAVIQEFNEYIRELKRHIERAKVLKERAKSTAELVVSQLQAPKFESLTKK